jgi:signal transduction histidine kinase
MLLLYPRRSATRHVVAVSQMLWSALLIHLTGGRIETHFHVFGSLAFLAFYRDWKVLIPATLVVVGDHFLRGLYWPESVYGTANPESWRFLEHAFWVFFEDAFLTVAIVQSVQEMREMARRRAEIESASAGFDMKLRETQDLLTRAAKVAAMGQLAAGVAHEINNPLAYVGSNCSYAIDELQRALAPSCSEDARRAGLLRATEALQEACQGSERVGVIVQDLKTLSRSDSGARAPIDLVKIIESSIKIASNQIRHRAELVKEIEPDLPWILGSASHLGQVFLNLLINAAQAIEPGAAGRNQICVRARRRGARAVVEVSDTGAGIARELQERIFEPFFTTKPVGVGAGLGLAICHSVVSQMGGELTGGERAGQGEPLSGRAAARGRDPGVGRVPGGLHVGAACSPQAASAGDRRRAECRPVDSVPNRRLGKPFEIERLREMIRG